MDTASPTVTLAVGATGNLSHTSLPISKSSVELLGAIDSLLAEHGCSARDLDGILCTAGPGSFTGIRVGMATVMGLGESLDLPTVALPSLWIQAHWASQKTLVNSSRIASALAAHRDQCFVQMFRFTPVPRSDGPIHTTTQLLEELEDPEVPIVSCDPTVRERAKFGGQAVLDPGPLATHLVVLATTNPPLETPGDSEASVRNPQGSRLFDWDARSLSRPLYAQTPAVAARPKVLSGALRGSPEGSGAAP